jgi:hypothetical protein
LSQNIASGGSQLGAFPNLPGVPQPLNTPTQDRTDLVYLDVWEREVDSSEDPDLINEKIGVETCRRTKREWVVLVAEGMSNPENLTAAGGHACYPLALLHRKGGVAEISSSDIVDLRRAGVASISAPLTIKDNKVGIGMTSPEAKLTLRTPDQEETDTLRIEYFSAPQASHLTFNGYSYSNLPGLGSGISWVFNQRDEGTDYPVLTFFKGNVSIGRSLPTAKLEICADEFTDLTPALLLRGGTDNFPSLQFVDANSNTKYRICSSLGLLRIEPVGDSTGMSIDSLGNVGIGKTDPETKLHISGSDDVTISIDAPQNREAGIVFRTHGKDYVDWEFYRDESGDLRIWDGKIHINRVTVKPDGNVGIGTINPGEYKLCVSGDTKIEGNLTFGGDIITCTGGPETTLEGVNGTEHTVWFHYYDRNVLGIRHSSISGQQSWKVVIPAGVSFVQEK